MSINGNQKALFEEFEIIEKKEQGAFYFTKDKQRGFLTITLGYKDIDPRKCIEAKIAPTEGSNLFSLKINDNDFLWYNPELPLADFVTGTPVLFPFPNRIEDAMWKWKGKAYLQKKNGIPIQLHSLVYNEKTWEHSDPVFEDQSVLLKTYINVDESHPIYKGYPFKFLLSLNFRITANKFTISYEVKNRDNKEMPFGFALHPYFAKLSGENGTLICVPFKYWYENRTDVDETFLCKRLEEYLQIPNILPSGKLLSTDTEGKDLKNAVPVSSVNLDHVFTGLIEGKFPYIDYTSLRLRLHILSSNDFTHSVVYTPLKTPYFCIEPQTCSTDAVNLYESGIDNSNLIILYPGNEHIGYVDFIPEYY